MCFPSATDGRDGRFLFNPKKPMRRTLSINIAEFALEHLLGKTCATKPLPPIRTPFRPVRPLPHLVPCIHFLATSWR